MGPACGDDPHRRHGADHSRGTAGHRLRAVAEPADAYSGDEAAAEVAVAEAIRGGAAADDATVLGVHPLDGRPGTLRTRGIRTCSTVPRRGVPTSDGRPTAGSSPGATLR